MIGIMGLEEEAGGGGGEARFWEIIRLWAKIILN